MKAQRSINITAAPGKIWLLLVDPENIKKWCQPAIRIFRTSEQRNGLGATFYFEERAIGQLLKLNFVVTEWAENRRVTFKLTSGNLVKGYEQRYLLEPTKTGIHVTCFEDVIMPFGFLGKCMGLFRAPVTGAHLERNLAGLKLLGEAV
jgi:hypothetical protein